MAKLTPAETATMESTISFLVDKIAASLPQNPTELETIAMTGALVVSLSRAYVNMVVNGTGKGDVEKFMEANFTVIKHNICAAKEVVKGLEQLKRERN